MTESPAIETHLEELRRRLGHLFWLLPFRKKRLLAEAESHLRDCARHLKAEGLGEAEAVRRFGDSRDLVRQWARAEIRSTLAPLVALVTLATVAAGVLTLVTNAPSMAFPGSWIQFAIALFVIAQGASTAGLLFHKRGIERIAFLGSFALLAVGLVATTRGWTGPDPEYWIPLLGMLLVAQSIGTLVSLRPPRFLLGR